MDDYWCIDSTDVKLALKSSKTVSSIIYSGYLILFTHTFKKDSRKLLNLLKNNMFELYFKYWKWNSKDKLRELTLEVMRYIIIYNEDDIVGFSSYTFIHEHDDDGTNVNVLYLFEIQVNKMHMGNGLGRLMMEHLERTAKQAKMREIRLTCIRQNPILKWYLSNSFVVHSNHENTLQLKKLINENGKVWDTHCKNYTNS